MQSMIRGFPGIVVASLALVALAGGCATGGSTGRGWQGKRPVLYPNDHYQRMGVEAAEMDVSQCMARADVGAPQESQVGKAAVNTLGGAAAGAALGAIGGAIVGNAGTGAAAGAAVGATGGAIKTAVDSRNPDQTYQGYVQACLRERGYEVIGWK